MLATDVAEDKLNDLAEAFIVTRRLDVTDPEAIAACRRAATGRHPVQLRRLRASRHDPRLRAEDWDFSFDLNVTLDVPMIRAFLPKMLEHAARGLDHQHGLDASSVKGVAEPFRLWRHQGRRDRADQGGGGRFHQAGRALQRDLPGHGRTASLDDRIACWRLCTGGTSGAPGLRRAPADGTARHARGGRPLAVYLATDEAAFTTGAIHIIDGGFTL